MAELVKIDVKGSPSSLVTASPAGDGPFPAILVTIHGGGLDEFEYDLADRLAAEGYIVAAPDIFHRQPDETDAAVRRANLKDSELIDDMNAGLAWLESTGRADMGKVGILGHCMGGRQAYLGASVNPIIRCVVSYYGGNVFVPWGDDGPSPFERLGNLKVPVIAFYGNDDENPSPEDVNKLEAEFKRLKVDYEFHRYDGAGHAFQNFVRPEGYREAATKDSWSRTVPFLKTHLG